MIKTKRLFTGAVVIATGLIIGALNRGVLQTEVVVLGLMVATSALIPFRRVVNGQTSKAFEITAITFSFVAFLVAAESGARMIDELRRPGITLFPIEVASLGAPSGRDFTVVVSPSTGGHDAKGFRNDAVPQQVDIVALGDSHTWGHSVTRYEAWVQVLGRLSNHTVYNMGHGGYGPAQYWALTDDALALSPKVIIIGLYFGNDIYDAYGYVYEGPADQSPYARFRREGVTKEQFNDNVDTRARESYLESLEYRPRVDPVMWLEQNTALGRLLFNGVSQSRYYDGYKRWALANPENAVVYETDHFSTILTTLYRWLPLDLDIPENVEGLRITKEVLRDIDHQARTAGVKIVVLLLPTKELVYAEAVQAQQGELSDTYARLVEMETRARNDIIAFLDTNAIDSVDGLIAYRQAVARNEPIFQPSIDGHPTLQGHAVIASALHESLKAKGIL